MLGGGIGSLSHCVLMQDHIQEEVFEIEGGCGNGKNLADFTKQAGNA